MDHLEIDLDALLSKEITQELPRPCSEGTLVGVKSHARLVRFLEDIRKILKMFLKLSPLHQHIIDVHIKIFSYHFLELFIYKALIVCPNVFETKWHYNILEKTLVGYEGYMRLVGLCHSDLVIVAEGVQK